MSGFRRLLGGSALAVLAASAPAAAGGFQRGQPDIDILFEPGSFSTRLSVSYVNPNRGFDTIDGVNGDFGDYTGNYLVPNYAVKFGNEIAACAGNYTESFAAEADYSGSPGGALPPASRFGVRTRTLEFDANEFSVNCRLSYVMEGARVSLLGGVFFEDFDFTGSSNIFAPGPAGSFPVPGVGLVPGQVLIAAQTNVSLRGEYQTGFRIGAAYEIPAVALRAQILYRSEVKNDEIRGEGTITSLGGANTIVFANGASIQIPGLPAGAPLAVLPAAFNEVTSPQSLNINVQTGIAEGTLLVGSFRWTDWSTNREVVTTLGSNPGSVFPYHWDDGYTVGLGLGRAFNDSISGLVSIGYDSGVSTGAETTYTDLYTVSGGLSFRQDFGEVRVGGLVGYWTDGEQSVSRGALFDGSVGDDWVYAANVSLKLTF